MFCTQKDNPIAEGVGRREHVTLTPHQKVLNYLQTSGRGCDVNTFHQSTFIKELNSPKNSAVERTQQLFKTKVKCLSVT